MKKFLRLLAAAALFAFVALLAAGCGGQKAAEEKKEQPQAKQEAQQEIKLKMADSFPVTHLFSADIAKFFIKRTEELTNGKVKIEYYPAEQLGKLKDLLNLTSQGVADIAYVAPTFLAGQLPLNTVMVLPNYTTAKEGSAIYHRLAGSVLMDEFKKYGVRPIFVYTTPQYDVGTVKKQIKSPGDLKGMKIKTSGGIYDKIAQKYGVTPVVVPSPEIYEATQRGIVEGNFLSYVSVKGYRVYELEKYHTLGAAFGGYPVAYVINEKTWEKLPADIQKALLQAGEETSKHAGEVIDKQQEELAVEFEKQGMVIYRLTPEEQKKWREPLKGIENEWIQDMEKKGLPGKKVYEEFEKVCKEIVKS